MECAVNAVMPGRRPFANHQDEKRYISLRHIKIQTIREPKYSGVRNQWHVFQTLRIHNVNAHEQQGYKKVFERCRAEVFVQMYFNPFQSSTCVELTIPCFCAQKRKAPSTSAQPRNNISSFCKIAKTYACIR